MKTLKLIFVTASAVAVFWGCGNMPVIDQESDPLRIVVEDSFLSGTFRQGVEVSGATITLSYQNGLGRQAEVVVPQVNGIYSDPYTTTLAAANGTLEITLKGVPETGDETTLRPTIKLSTHDVFTTFAVTPSADIVLEADGSSYDGTFKIFQPVQNGAISMKYNSIQDYTVSISVAELMGISGPEFQTVLPAAPNDGFVNIPLEGTPTDQGMHDFTVRMVKGDQVYNMVIAIEIVGEVTFDIAASSVSGIFVVDQELIGAFITLHYTADRNMDMTINVAAVDGVYADAFQATLTAGSGSIDIPLQGTPDIEGDKTITITLEENNIVYTAPIPVTFEASGPGVEFESETIIYEQLTYRTIHVDMNANGYVNRGEVWLDRNIGATSTDPASPDSYGHYYQYGVAYGTPYQDGYNIDFGAMTPWDICPEGYHVPTMEEFLEVIHAVVPGSTIDTTPFVYYVAGEVGITNTIVNSTLKLPLVGAYANGALDNVGVLGYYWTATEGSNTAPWRIELNAVTTDRTGANWSGGEWQHPVRCIKTL